MLEADETRTRQLVDLLQKGNVRSEDLTYEQAEEVLFEIFRRRLSLSFPHATIKRHKRGPIDLVIESAYESPSISPGRLETHKHVVFIECKHRNHRLELDETAKVYLVALLEAPDELVVVAKWGLGPQAQDYAYHLFSTGTSNGLFKHIRFSTTSLDEILGIQHPAEKRGTAGTEESRAVRRPFFALWQTTGGDEREVPVSSGTGIKRRLAISAYDLFSLKVSCDWKPTAAWFNTRAGARVDLPALNPTARMRSANEAEYHIEFAFWDELISAGKVSVHVADDRGNHGELFIDGNMLDVTIDDLCRFYTVPNEWQKRLQGIKTSNPRILFVTGNAGIGKSTFCRELLGQYRRNGARCHQITVSRYTTEEVLFHLLWTLIWPEGQAPTREVPEISQDLITECIKKLLGNDHDGEQLARDILTRKVMPERAVESIMLLAQLLARHPDPQIVLFQDCQHFSSSLIHTLSQILDRLSDASFSASVTLIFEYRSEQDNHSGEWRQFANQTLCKYPATSDQVTLEPFTEEDLRAACTHLVPQTDIDDVIDALFKKAGGNPLYVSQVLRMFIRDGYFVPAAILKTYTVADWVALKDRLRVMPSSLHELLRYTANQLFLHAQERLVTPNMFVRYLALLSYFRHRSTAGVLNQMGLGQESVQEYDSFLINYGICRNSTRSSRIHYVHELIELAVIERLKLSPDFVPTAHYLKQQVRRETPLDFISLGNMLKDSRDNREAFLAYDYAATQAQNDSLYQYQRLALEGCRALIEQDSSSPELFRKRIAVGLKLGTVETQVGSQVHARRVLDKLTAAINASHEIQWESSAEKIATASDVCRAQLVLHTRMLQPFPFMEALAHHLRLYRVPRSQQLSLMTRFVLMCCATNFPDVGRQGAACLLGHWAELSTEERSSVMSDIGRIYLQCIPLQAQLIWNQGNELESSERQRCHNALNVLIGTLYGAGILPEGSVCDVLEQSINRMGVANLQIRLGILRSISLFVEERLDDAIYMTRKLLDKTKQTNHTFWMWKCHNNLGVALAHRGNQQEAKEHISRAATLLQDIIRFSIEGRATLREVFELVGGGLQSETAPDILRIESPFSGLFRVLLHNAGLILSIEERAELNIPFVTPSEPPIHVQNGHPLIVDYNGRPLYLAIE